MKYKAYINRLKSTFSRKKTIVRDQQLMHPDREWAIGLFIAGLIFSVCGLWSIHSYLKNRSATALPVEDTTGVTVYRESVVKEALQTVGQRKRRFDELTRQPVPIEPVVEETTPDAIEAEVPEVVEEVAPSTDTPTLGE